jgi:hypothetical protein
MKNKGHKLRTWRNKIGRDSKIQEFKKVLKPPFHPTHGEKKMQDIFEGRGNISKEFTKTGYLDYNFTQVVQPLNLFILEGKSPKNRLIELSAIIREAAKKKLKIKAIGSGHSYSDIGTTNDCLVLTDELKEVLENPKGKNRSGIMHDEFLDPEAPFVKKIRDSTGNEKRFLYEFESGIKIHALNEALEKHDPPLGLDNMGTYQGQSFIGAASTSTHGSGIGLGALPDMIRSICIVSENGNIFRIEPEKNYLTQKGKIASGVRSLGFNDDLKTEGFRELQKKGHLMYSPDDANYLIQDDDWFNAAICNVGCFGVVYSLIIEVGRAYDLFETIEWATWSNLRVRLNNQDADLFEHKEVKAEHVDDPMAIDQLETKNGSHPIRHMEILVNPYKDELHQENYCRITRRYKSYKLHKIKKDRSPGDVAVTLAKMFAINPQSEGATVEKNEKKHQHINNNVIFRAANKPGLSPKERTKHIIEKVGKGNYFPLDDEKVPGGKKKWYYRNRAWKVFPLGGDAIGGYGAETGFTMENHTKAVDRLIEIAAETLETGGQAQNVPFSLRYVAGSSAFLSPQYGDDVATNTIKNKVKASSRPATCMVELLNTYDTIGGKELLRRYQLAMFAYGGRPHWGLDMNIMSGFFLQQNMYPAYNKWKKVYDSMNANGSFDNAFTHRMGWSIPRYLR